MTHNIYYCTIHKKVLHGMRPAGPHFTARHGMGIDCSIDPIDTAMKLGALKDLGVCPYFKFRFGFHKNQVEAIDKKILEKMNETTEGT